MPLSLEPHFFVVEVGFEVVFEVVHEAMIEIEFGKVFLAFQSFGNLFQSECGLSPHLEILRNKNRKETS